MSSALTESFEFFYTIHNREAIKMDVSNSECEATTNQTLGSGKVFYNSLKELVLEWQTYGGESSLWEYLGMTQSTFRNWIDRSKNSEVDA